MCAVETRSRNDKGPRDGEPDLEWRTCNVAYPYTPRDFICQIYLTRNEE